MTSETEVVDGSELERILCLMADVVSKSSTRQDACVYRGEPECYPTVSSGLYRACRDSANEAFDIARVEEEVVAAARRYTTLVDDEEILTEIQHFGGVTNLIDFTDDYLVALFFACGGNEQTDGRVVLHWPEPGTEVRPKDTLSRIVSQKSVFIRPGRGFVVPDAIEETVVVPGDLKGSVLTFLERFHGISEATVYRDIHGFISQQAPNQDGYAVTFQESLSKPRPDPIRYLEPLLEEEDIFFDMMRLRHGYHQRGMVYEDAEGSRFSFSDLGTPSTSYICELNAEEIVEVLTILIENRPYILNRAEVHCWRGEAYLYQGQTDLAMLDFAEALDKNAEMAEAFHGRGNAYRHQGDSDRSMADLEEALRLKPDLAAVLIDRGNMHRESGDLEEAIRDFDRAITLLQTPAVRRRNRIGVGDGHFYRAVARCERECWAGARDDFALARQEGVLVASSFQSIFGGVSRFEADHGLRMPSPVATILYIPPAQSGRFSTTGDSGGSPTMREA